MSDTKHDVRIVDVHWILAVAALMVAMAACSGARSLRKIADAQELAAKGGNDGK